MIRVLLVVLVVAALAWGGSYWLDTTRTEAPGTPPAEDEPTLGGRPLSEYYLEHDRFLASIDPEVIPAAEATWLRPSDEVFGVVVDDHARAYPITMIAYNHVVNDVIEGIPIAVTY